MTAIQDGDFVVAGGAASSASTVIVAGGAVPATGAEDLTIQAGGSDIDGFRTGLFQFTGYALNAELRPVQTLEAGQFDLLGEPVEALASRLLEPVSGEFEHSGYDLQGFRFARTLEAETRVLVLDGFQLNTKLNLALGANPGSLALTGYALAAIGQRFVILDAGSALLTGNELTARKDPRLQPQSGAFTLTGYELLTPSDKSIFPVRGQLFLTGNAADFSRVAGVLLDTSSFALTGFDVALDAQNRYVEPTAGLLALTGGVLNFTITRQEVFGANRPTTRRFTPGSFFFSRSETFAGSESRRIWGTTAQNATLELEYTNIFEATGLEMLQLYEKCYGGYASVALPSAILSGAEESVKSQYLLSGTRMRWYFAEPPKIKSVFPGVCDVSIRFIGKVSYQR